MIVEYIEEIIIEAPDFNEWLSDYPELEPFYELNSKLLPYFLTKQAL